MTDLAAVLLPLQLKIMTVTSWVHGRHLALPVAPSSRDLTAVLLHLNLGRMMVTRRVHGGTLALPVDPSSRDLTAVLLPLHLVLMMVTRRVHDGPLALPAPTPTGPANGNVATQVMITMITRLVEVTMTSSPKTSRTSTLDEREWP